MSVERFALDTNILIYSMDSNAGDRQVRAARVIELARRRDCWLTLQAVSEFFVAAIRKQVVSRTEAADQANDWLSMFPTVPASVGAVRIAMTAVGRASYWDALLIASAAEAGCTSILTEDMADGGKLYDVRILNPLAGKQFSEPVRLLLGGE
jgi:predicted nucleic acid-binding protein